jgi:hypothetical protein
MVSIVFRRSGVSRLSCGYCYCSSTITEGVELIGDSSI